MTPSVAAEVDDLARPVDAGAVEDLELGLAEGRRHLFLTTLTRAFVPMTTSPFLTTPVLRMSSRTLA